MENVKKIINLFNTKGNTEYFGESVSKTEHMIQTAMAAKKNNENDDIIIGCLLHDIGHFLDNDNMNGLGVIEHGKIGADFLRQLNMSENICRLVEYHVLAKKYLVSKYEDYYNKLSDASKQTLEYQGGKMTLLEMKQFEQMNDYNNILKIRNYDDIGKNTDSIIPNIETFTDLLLNYL